MSTESRIRALFQQILELRLDMLPESEHTGSVTAHFQDGKVRKVKWETYDDADQWVDQLERPPLASER